MIITIPTDQIQLLGTLVLLNIEELKRSQDKSDTEMIRARKILADKLSALYEQASTEGVEEIRLSRFP